VIELRLVVAALNQVPRGTFDNVDDWQATFVDFFNAKYRNEEFLPHAQHQQKTRAVDKWIEGEHLSDQEMRWIKIMRDVWRKSRDQLRGFGPSFKLKLNSVLRMN